MFLSTLTTVLALTFQSGAAPAPALKGLDPVELGRGREVPGDPKLGVDRGTHHYVFQNEANKQAFLADPERLGIQWGGACGRMGPGSGSARNARSVLGDRKSVV